MKRLLQRMRRWLAFPLKLLAAVCVVAAEWIDRPDMSNDFSTKEKV